MSLTGRSGLDTPRPSLLGAEDLAPARLRWWREAAIVAVFYGVYTAVRDVHGRRPVSAVTARANAVRIVHLERWLHVFAEQRLQAAFLHDRLLVSLLDDYYGIVHFAAVVVLLVVLYRRYPDRYPLWRNTLAITTGVALVGFFVYPVMPPRLLPPSFHFVDTLQVVGGLWDFGSAPVDTVSNQFAAMPSLHTAWSVWCALAVATMITSPRRRLLVVAYPALTVFCIVVTGNHYFADALGGLVTVGVAAVAAHLVTGRMSAWRIHRMARKDLLAA